MTNSVRSFDLIVYLYKYLSFSCLFLYKYEANVQIINLFLLFLYYFTRFETALKLFALYVASISEFTCFVRLLQYFYRSFYTHFIVIFLLYLSNLMQRIV